jgi:hypothetical protein
MRRIVLSLAITATFLGPTLHAQNAVATSQPAVQTCPPTATLEELTKALDDAVSGPGNKDRTCFRELFVPGARMTPIRKTTDGAFSPHMLTVEDWINAVARRGSEAFYERQVKVRTETYGHFAHLWSTYEIRDTPDGPIAMMGINSIQAVNDGAHWKLLSVLWEPDTTAGPIPEKYKP